jgi:hypothetical protein
MRLTSPSILYCIIGPAHQRLLRPIARSISALTPTAPQRLTAPMVRRSPSASPPPAKRKKLDVALSVEDLKPEEIVIVPSGSPVASTSRLPNYRNGVMLAPMVRSGTCAFSWPLTDSRPLP